MRKLLHEFEKTITGFGPATCYKVSNPAPCQLRYDNYTFGRVNGKESEDTKFGIFSRMFQRYLAPQHYMPGKLHQPTSNLNFFMHKTTKVVLTVAIWYLNASSISTQLSLSVSSMSMSIYVYLYVYVSSMPMSIYQLCLPHLKHNLNSKVKVGWSLQVAFWQYRISQNKKKISGTLQRPGIPSK